MVTTASEVAMIVSDDDDMQKHALLALSLLPGIGVAALCRLLQLCPTPLTILRNPRSITAELRDRATIEKIANADIDMALEAATLQHRLAEEVGVTIVTCFDKAYPKNLTEVALAPPVLFVRGHLHPEDHLSVAIVGTRQASIEGQGRARKLAGLLAERGVTVVSGLARGIDTAAHQATLSSGGHTIAVVGTGLDRTYPAENAVLADQIADQGAIVSQFPMRTPPSSHNFPMRNKTMALLSLVTVVVEAGEVSGAKMQADYALRLKHDLVERKVFLAQSLIDKQDETGWAREFLARGAKPLRDVEDIIAALPLPKIAVQRRLPL